MLQHEEISNRQFSRNNCKHFFELLMLGHGAAADRIIIYRSSQCKCKLEDILATAISIRMHMCRRFGDKTAWQHEYRPYM